MLGTGRQDCAHPDANDANGDGGEGGEDSDDDVMTLVMMMR